MEKKNVGFAAMGKEDQRQIASKGGKTVVALKGVDYMRMIGKKGSDQRTINAKKRKLGLPV